MMSKPTANDSTYQKHIAQLFSDDPNEVIEAAHALGDLGDQQAVPSLLELLRQTSHHDIRDAVAVALRDLADDGALQPLISLVLDPKTEGHRGTLVYALGGLKCSSVLPFLVDLVIAGNFEVSHEAFLAIESIESEIDPQIWDLCLEKIRAAVPQSQREKVELLEELLEVFEEDE
jgi:hypothetical protein